jgi:SAM-dependent methyltransferase
MSMSAFASAEPWNLVADGYGDEVAWLMGPFSERAAELAALDDRSDVVDVACGPGTTALAIAPRVKSVRGIDFSEAMVARMRREIEARGLRNATAQVGDGQALPFDDASFDAAFSMFGLMFFPDRARGFRELHRVLRPGGRAVVSSWAPFDRSPLMQAMFGSLQAADPSVPQPKPDPTSLENPEVFESELRAAGFVDVKIHTHEQAITVEDADALWSRMVRSSAPIAMMRRRVGDTEWSKRETIARAWLRERITAPTTLATTAFLAAARRPG